MVKHGASVSKQVREKKKKKWWQQQKQRLQKWQNKRSCSDSEVKIGRRWVAKKKTKSRNSRE